MRTRYFIKKDGLPDYSNALELPCENKAIAEAEVIRLNNLPPPKCGITGREKPRPEYSLGFIS